MDTKDDITNMMKLRSLECFCEVIPDHVQVGIKFHICFLFRGSTSDEIISDIDVGSPLAN